MKYIVKCANCNLSLTNQLKELAHVSMLASELEKERAPIGAFGVEHGDIIVNSSDVINTKYHPDENRLRGCCGIAGYEGLTTVCLNGHEVATERSDCTDTHSITFHGSAAWLERIWIDET